MRLLPFRYCHRIVDPIAHTSTHARLGDAGRQARAWYGRRPAIV
jgi:hypothetical protein